MAILDLLGSPFSVGDCFMQPSEQGPCKVGLVTDFSIGADGQSYIKTSGNFRQRLCPKNLLSLSALGVPTEAVEREEVFPDRPYEYNRERLCDALGREARAGDEVIFCRTRHSVAKGVIRHFSSGKVVIHPEYARSNCVLTRSSGQFVICHFA